MVTSHTYSLHTALHVFSGSKMIHEVRHLIVILPIGLANTASQTVAADGLIRSHTRLTITGRSHSKKNKKQATHWALRAFDQWRKNRYDNPAVLFECPADLLEASYPDDVLDHRLTAFILEVRKANGGQYTPDFIELHNCRDSALPQMLFQGIAMSIETYSYHFSPLPCILILVSDLYHLNCHYYALP